ncbi:hypothetical protein BCR32DRAFT_267580 [Anaeromyces robustus]|uniref:CAAX prenyl protease 2/Lysostaphin resistance protein A-like domain-containing protein n=1 Tax=Anaeromyces robustus TaxID=1754192 RepID=A0A1Y1X9S4_9FUNG|nr:hypothetical protein BCR32DRAFT_267580 [Anaeromyces robustus]|eukprot:ORX82495.1 hypothetical protein BCR32DRAFT_267580 [Anaeromyces robustus]
MVEIKNIPTRDIVNEPIQQQINSSSDSIIIEEVLNNSSSSNIIEDEKEVDISNSRQHIMIKRKSIIVDIPVRNQSQTLIYNKAKKETRNIGFFQQFLVKRIYIVAFVSFIVLWVLDILNGLFIETFVKNIKNTNEVGLDSFSNKHQVLAILYACLIGPIWEEIVFRRVIFKLLCRFSNLIAYVISSFLFAFYHFGFSFTHFKSEVYNLPFYFLVGINLAYTYNYDGYILASILSHLLYNCTTTLLEHV